MERITDSKFQKLNVDEMSHLKGGAPAIVTEGAGGWDQDKLTNNGVKKSKNDGDWFWKKDEWGSSVITIEP
jgi:hypothetical protein